MTPVRSVAASVVALGFACTLTAPMPAFATPAPCQLVDHYAAQAGAQVLRINRLDLGPLATPSNRRGTPDRSSEGEPSPADGAERDDPGSDDPGSRAGAARDHDGQSPPTRRAPAGSGEPDGAGHGKTDGAGSGKAGGAGHGKTDGAGTGKAGGAGTGKAGGAGTGKAGGANSGKAGGAGEPGQAGPGAAGEVGTSGEAGKARGAGEQRATRPTITPAAFTESRPTPQSIGGVGLGDSRTVVIADNPVRSAAAARLLDGRVPGSANDLVVQQAPPHNPRPTGRQTVEKRFGPLRAGAAHLTAHARWNTEVECGTAEASASSAQLKRITLTGAGNESLLRVPEKISGLSSTALRHHDGRIESVASATMIAGRISLADGEVRIRVVRAPSLQVGMSAAGQHRVDYRPAAIEVSGKNIATKRLDTARDHIDITLSDEVRELESLPALIKPIDPLPLPPIEGLPTTGEPETTPAPGRTGGTKLRISLGDVRQASTDKAVAARADAIRISLIRDRQDAQDSRMKPGYGPSSMVADLGIGLLEGAAVAPQPGSGVSSGVSPGVPSAGSGGGGAGLPITGPGAVSLALGGAALLLGGIGAFLLGSRKRRVTP